MRQVYINNLENKLTQLFEQMKSEHNHYRFKLFSELFEKNYPEDYQRMQLRYAEECQEFRKNRKGNKKPKPVPVNNRLRRYYDRYIYEHIMKPRNEQREKQEQKLITSARKVQLRVIKSNGKFNIYNLKTNKLLYENLGYKEVKKIINSRRNKNEKK